MTAYEREVRDTLERMAKTKGADGDAAKSALKKLNPETVGRYMRDGKSVSDCVVAVLVD